MKYSEGETPPRRVPRLLDDYRFPAEIRSELIPEFKRLLLECTKNDACVLNLLTYCALWHPNLPHDLRNRHKALVKRAQLPIAALTNVVTQLSAESDLNRLLADRGPDFGWSLLIVLELCFQVAFCLRKPSVANNNGPKDKRNDLQRVFHGCSKLLETLSLHLDCPPLNPHYHLKFALTCVGFLYHRKLPAAAQSRFFQLHYFTSPEIRELAFERQPLAWEGFHQANPQKCYLPAELMEAVETYLWDTARELSLGQAPKTSAEGLSVHARQAAMAVTFEVMNHVSHFLFGTSLCLYGSAATGFVTVDSDVDVVLQLGDSGIARMMSEIKACRKAGKPDVNPFPSRSSAGFQRAIGDWEWATERPETIAATIWAGRKLAWACHRFLGWEMQCVQTAYVPIIRVHACVDENGFPRILPHVLRPCQNLETRFLPCLSKWRRLCRPGQDIRSLLLEDILVAHPVVTKKKNKGLKDPARVNPLKYRAAIDLVSQVAINVVSENQYRHWDVVCYDEGLLTHAETLVAELAGSDPVNDSSEHFNALQEHLRSFVTDQLSHELTLDRLVIAEPGLSRVPPELLYPDGRLAKVDQLDCRDDDEEPETIWLVESDCSMDRAVGIHNSRLLRAYASCDPRVVALGLLVKHWARRRDVGDAFAGYLSGYQWTLMVIHFLQHYLCLPPPDWLQSDPDFADFAPKLIASSRSAARLPLLPNLQRPPSSLGPFKPVTHQEMEGEADVFFYEPGAGQNHPLPRRLQEACRDPQVPTPTSTPLAADSKVNYKTFPEDDLLTSSPLDYALRLLSCPFDLQSRRHDSSKELWRCRAHTAPRPTGASKARSAEHRRKWDIERRKVKAKMFEEENNHSDRRQSISQRRQEPYPALGELRSTQFDRDHLVTRESLVLPFDGEDVSLTELFYAFFEYYGMRFNYATEMSDIDRVPSMPAAKKEFFETAIFKPTMEAKPAENPTATKDVDQWEESADSSCEESHPAMRENRGRGKGAFQFQGRHFVCIRDPFEKLRTIGPMFRCQSHLSAEILSAMQTIGWTRLVTATDLNEAKASVLHRISKVFEHRHAPGHLFHPVREGLADLLNRCSRMDRMGDENAGDFGHLMYPELGELVRKYGNYAALMNGRVKPSPEPPLGVPPGFDPLDSSDGLRRAFIMCRMFNPNEGRGIPSRIIKGSGWRYFPGAKAWLERRSGFCEHTRQKLFPQHPLPPHPLGNYPPSRRVSVQDLRMDRVSDMLISCEASLPRVEWTPQEKRQLEEHLLRIIQGRKSQ